MRHARADDSVFYSPYAESSRVRSDRRKISLTIFPRVYRPERRARSRAGWCVCFWATCALHLSSVRVYTTVVRVPRQPPVSFAARMTPIPRKSSPRERMPSSRSIVIPFYLTSFLKINYLHTYCLLLAHELIVFRDFISKKLQIESRKVFSFRILNTELMYYSMITDERKRLNFQRIYCKNIFSSYYFYVKYF